jgi:hypothetical protein
MTDTWRDDRAVGIAYIEVLCVSAVLRVSASKMKNT